jgi:predicted nucleotidyltransferase
MNFDPRVEKHAHQHPHYLVFATISGAHLYGFPSPDSDYDLRGIHVLPLSSVLGLHVENETVSNTTIDNGLEIDLVTHDVKKFFGLMLKNNGYVLEQLLSPLVVRTSPEHEELIAISDQCITRHHGHHYLGFAETQWRLFMRDNPPKVKPLLYIYRVLLTGIHLMQTGIVEANLSKLNEIYKLPYIPEMIQLKVNGTEKGFFNDANLAFHEAEYLRLRKRLEEAMSESNLPKHASAEEALNDLLIRIRLQHPSNK